MWGKGVQGVSVLVWSVLSLCGGREGGWVGRWVGVGARAQAALHSVSSTSFLALRSLLLLMLLMTTCWCWLIGDENGCRVAPNGYRGEKTTAKQRDVRERRAQHVPSRRGQHARSTRRIECLLSSASSAFFAITVRASSRFES